MNADTSAAPATRLVAARRLLFLAGLAIGLVMVLRAQASGDQFELLVLGWQLYGEHSCPPYGCGISGGGLYPGSLTALLTGLPFFAWADHRSAALLTLLLNALGYLLLDRTLRGILDLRERLALCAVYWLNPWHLFFAAHLWNPNWLFPLSAVHLWTLYRQRHHARFLESMLQVLIIGMAFQLHGSFMMLAVMSALLWLRGYLKIHWLGAALGALLTVLSLVPYFLEATRHPEILPLHGGYIGRGLVHVYPVLRGVLYWLLYPSLSWSSKLIDFDFTPSLGPVADTVLTLPLRIAAWTMGIASVLLVLLAYRWLWQQARSRVGFRRFAASACDRDWLLGTVLWSCIAALATFCLSPTTITHHQGLIGLHIAGLPLVLWFGDAWRQANGPWLTRIGLARMGRTYVGFALVAALAMSIAAPMYRLGGRRPIVLAVKEWHPLLDRLGLARTCTVVVDKNGWSANILDHAHSRLER